jgi:hypothetical protein
LSGGGGEADEEARLAACLAGCRALLAYGLVGEVIAGLRPIGLDYMGAQAAWLRDGLGLDTAVVPLPTAAAVEANADRVAAVLTADPRPVLLVAHSKGGLEALAALLRPGVAETVRCRAFVAIQAPFHGSPVADAVCRRGPVHAAARRALRLLRTGSGEGLADLTTAARAAWMAAHAAELDALTRRVPVVTVASVLDGTEGWSERHYRPLTRWMARRGAGPSDGLVPLASTRLPGARGMLLRGGHRALVAAGRGRDPVGVLRRALALALLAPEEAAAATPP